MLVPKPRQSVEYWNGLHLVEGTQSSDKILQYVPQIHKLSMYHGIWAVRTT
jgi:hypothetical protein